MPAAIWDACGVVDEREEQVLSDVAHGRLGKPSGADDAAQIALQQRDTGAFNRDVSAGSHRDPDFRRGESGCVVDAVSGHGDDASGLLQLRDDSALLVWKDLGLDVRNPQRSGDGVRRRLVVPDVEKSRAVRLSVQLIHHHPLTCPNLLPSGCFSGSHAKSVWLPSWKWVHRWSLDETPAHRGW